eukprot:Rmarinus@m.4008
MGDSPQCWYEGCSAKSPLKRCSACRIAEYCCRQHQLGDWKMRHKHDCKRLAANSPSSDEEDLQPNSPPVQRLESRVAPGYDDIPMPSDSWNPNAHIHVILPRGSVVKDAPEDPNIRYWTYGRYNPCELERSLVADDIILIHPGRYKLSKTGIPGTPEFSIAIIGINGSRDQIILEGHFDDDWLFQTNPLGVGRFWFANLTLKGFGYEGVVCIRSGHRTIFQPRTEDAMSVVELYNVDLVCEHAGIRVFAPNELYMECCRISGSQGSAVQVSGGAKLSLLNCELCDNCLGDRFHSDSIVLRGEDPVIQASGGSIVEICECHIHHNEGHFIQRPYSDDLPEDARGRLFDDRGNLADVGTANVLKILSEVTGRDLVPDARKAFEKNAEEVTLTLVDNDIHDNVLCNYHGCDKKLNPRSLCSPHDFSRGVGSLLYERDKREEAEAAARRARNAGKSGTEMIIDAMNMVAGDPKHRRKL